MAVATAPKPSPKSKTKLKPLGSRVVIKALDREEITKSGIVLPDTAKEKPQEGRVLAVGPGDRHPDTGQRIPVELKEGDRILFQKYAGTEFKLDDEELAVATVEEGLALREGGVNGPILVLFGPTDASEVGHAVAQDLILTVWDLTRARAVSEAASALRRTTRVHFKVDTGLTRLGAPMSEAATRYRAIRALPHLEIDGIFTHFATADEPE